jgi:hypothetical protein
MHTAVGTLNALSGVQARGRSPAASLPVPTPILQRMAGLRAPVKFADAICLGPVLSKTEVVHHRLAILCACRIARARVPGPSHSGQTKCGRGAGGYGFNS